MASVVVRAAAWPHLVALGVQRWTLAAWQVVPMEVWPYSFSGSEGGPDSFSLLHLVSGLNGLPRLCSRCQSAVRTCSAPLAACSGRAVGARLQPWGGRPWRLLFARPAQRAQRAAFGGAASGQGWRRARVQRAAHRVLDGGHAVGVRHQQRGPRRPILAALGQEVQRAALGGAAGAWVRRRARVQRAARRVLDGGHAVGVQRQQLQGRPRRPILAALGQEVQRAALGGAAGA